MLQKLLHHGGTDILLSHTKLFRSHGADLHRKIIIQAQITQINLKLPWIEPQTLQITYQHDENNEDDDFEEQYEKTKPLVPQIEDFAMKHNVSLEKGWKVELAKQFKKLITKKNKNSIGEKTVEIWKKIFEKFE